MQGFYSDYCSDPRPFSAHLAPLKKSLHILDVFVYKAKHLKYAGYMVQASQRQDLKGNTRVVRLFILVTSVSGTCGTVREIPRGQSEMQRQCSEEGSMLRKWALCSGSRNRGDCSWGLWRGCPQTESSERKLRNTKT